MLFIDHFTINDNEPQTTTTRNPTSHFLIYTSHYVLKSGDQSDKYITAIPEQIVLAAKALTIFFDPKYLLKIVLKKFFFPPQAKRFLPKS